MVLQERMDILPGQFRVVSQLTVLPTYKSFSGADPKTSISPGEHTSDIDAGEVLARGWLPGDTPNAVESEQAEFGAEPEITVGCLSNRVDDGFEKAVADGPGIVRVLTNVQRRIQGGSTTATRQENSCGNSGSSLHSQTLYGSETGFCAFRRPLITTEP
jgi:hypothetical protein